MRKLFRILPFDGVDYSDIQLTILNEGAEYVLHNLYGRGIFAVSGLDVDKFIELGILREEMPKWCDDKLAIEFYHYVNDNIDKGFMDELLANFKQLKGIE